MKPIRILLVEDNEGDVILTTEAFESAKVLTEISVVRDGKSAMEYLKKEGDYFNVDEPDLMLLDLNLPRKNGLEVLQFVKTNSKLMHIPVIILSTSSSKRDIDKCYENFANCYITKPVDIESFFSVISRIENFWLSIVKLPMKNASPNDQRQG
ncbi:MAG: response regulator [Ginsengibacter sp.]